MVILIIALITINFFIINGLGRPAYRMEGSVYSAGQKKRDQMLRESRF